ncbi:MAG TPA: phosphoribosylamine--glycine ligase [Candidatus Tumulicola sp.]|nr:phosphoribosylamine--glycine ligase [Candidatus Tumulicola sp.]
MKVLIVGSGAREHALAWKIARSSGVEAIFAAPGNAGTASLGTNWPGVSATDVRSIAARAAQEKIDLAVIGPEAALAAGVADALRREGVATFGPGRAGARLESSKAYAKQCMLRWGIPTAAFRVANDKKQAMNHLKHWQYGGVVVKADGLAAGKGVVVFDSADEASGVVERWYEERSVPGGGTCIVLEEKLAGKEVSVMAITDGTRAQILEPACDYKRAGDGDTGPNTGGMGAYSPASDVVDGALLERVKREVIERARLGLERDGIEYRGCLYAGLMITSRGPYVLEFNARFGDPETQVVLPRIESGFLEALCEIAGLKSGIPHPGLKPRHYNTDIPHSSSACVAVVMTSDGYPESSKPVSGLPAPAPQEDVTFFWGGSKTAGDKIDASGGRVLTVSALGDSIASARERAYAACSAYAASLPQDTTLRWRTDIAERASKSAVNAALTPHAPSG